MIYEGVIVSQPPAVPSSNPHTRYPGHPHWFELSRVELDQILPRLKGVKITHEHGACGQRVGEVLAAYYNKSGDACVRFRLDDNAVGRISQVALQRKLLSGLSLTHNRATYEPTEVSLVMEGAREKTGVTQCLTPMAPQTIPSQPKFGEEGHTQRNQQARGFVRASFTQVRPVTMAQAPPTQTPEQMAARQQAQMLAQNPQALAQALADLQTRPSAQALAQAKQSAMTGQAPGWQTLPNGRMRGDFSSNQAQYVVPPASMQGPGQAHPVHQPAGHSIPRAQVLQSLNTVYNAVMQDPASRAQITGQPMATSAGSPVEAASAAAAGQPPASEVGQKRGRDASMPESQSQPQSQSQSQPANPEGAQAQAQLGRKTRRRQAAQEQEETQPVVSQTDESAMDVDEQDPIERVVSSTGSISQSVKKGVLSKAIQQQKRIQQLEAEVKAMQAKAHEATETNNMLSRQFMDTVLPFLDQVGCCRVLLELCVCVCVCDPQRHVCMAGRVL